MVERTDFENCGQEMHALMTELFPICRSITGDGVRETLRVIRGYIPLTLFEVPSGTKVFDWIVPIFRRLPLCEGSIGSILSITPHQVIRIERWPIRSTFLPVRTTRMI